jgi:glycosyltransferase involved in cell wall biosynthesis
LEHERLGVTVAETERLLRENEQTFSAILDVARDHLRAGDVAAGFPTCELAAEFALHNHPGFFSSRELEELVLGMTNRPAQPPGGHAPAPERVGAVLHVMTEAYPTGGHTRLVQRWMEQDRSRRHSVALTKPCRTIPDWLDAAVRVSGGRLTQPRSDLDVEARAAELRQIASVNDIVLLHTHPFDCLPLVAFGERHDRPRVAFVNHADHVFSIGGAAADLVIHLGDAGRRLGQRRRGLGPHSTTMLPIPLGQATRTLTRERAKNALGLKRSNLVLCTAAASHKYDQLGEAHFLDLVAEVVARHPEVVLLAVGPAPDERWAAEAQATGGRIRPLGPLDDVDVQLDAADIYLDSYPVASNTSLLEAAIRGTPVVVFDPGPSSLAVLRAGDAGLGGSLTRARDVSSYKAAVEELIVNSDLRRRSGEQLADEVVRAHTGPGWQSACERVYSSLVARPRGAPLGDVPSRGGPDELDEALCRLGHAQHHSLEHLVSVRSELTGRAVPLPRPRTAPELTRRIAEGNASGLEARAAALDTGVTAMRDYIDALQHTVSWRVTAPLRRLRPRRHQP